VVVEVLRALGVLDDVVDGEGQVGVLDHGVRVGIYGQVEARLEVGSRGRMRGTHADAIGARVALVGSLEGERALTGGRAGEEGGQRLGRRVGAHFVRLVGQFALDAGGRRRAVELVDRNALGCLDHGNFSCGERAGFAYYHVVYRYIEVEVFYH